MSGGAVDPGLPQVETALVVDDDRINRTAIAEILAPDFRILLARDGQGALDILAREEVSLVLLDVSMPGLSGYEVLSRMKADARLTDVPVIFITGMSEETDEELGLRLGAADYVQKPVRPAILRARIQTQLNLLRQRRRLEGLALRDGLTGIHNRRSFDEAFQRALASPRRGQEPLGLVLFDVDHFKQYNDHYGHAAGDQALRAVAVLLAGMLQGTTDVLARYGGEEFALLLPGCGDLQRLMEAARSRVMAAAIPHVVAASGHGVLTLSGGGALLPPGAPLDGPALLARADALLYRAKAMGRNTVLSEGGPT